ncbi:recombinase family protein [Bdellovibrio bacteriovorus]|uniref:recombinase family protein n=1 Tax=Bdellovibrio bacteriovorus TaxID=959 RepID=UPI000685BC29|nr:recombinase family protein [Bdellovibrio bacteriovorus]
MEKNKKTNKQAILYARCSTELQQPEVQLEALRDYAHHVELNNTVEIVDQGYSGGTDIRPGLAELQKLVRRNVVSVVCVVRLDRMFRSLKHLLDMMILFDDHNVKFISIEDNIDFSTAIGKLQFQLLASFAEFERALIRERTIAGLAYAKSQGKTLGRPPLKLDQEILRLREQGMSYRKIEEQLGCSNTVIKRVLKGAAKSFSEKHTSEGNDNK